MSAMLKHILAAARERSWKSSRRDRGGGYREVADLEDDAGINESRDAGTETGDAQGGECSFVETLRWERQKRAGVGTVTPL